MYGRLGIRAMQAGGASLLSSPPSFAEACALHCIPSIHPSIARGSVIPRPSSPSFESPAYPTPNSTSLHHLVIPAFPTYTANAPPLPPVPAPQIRHHAAPFPSPSPAVVAGPAAAVADDADDVQKPHSPASLPFPASAAVAVAAAAAPSSD